MNSRSPPLASAWAARPFFAILLPRCASSPTRLTMFARSSRRAAYIRIVIRRRGSRLRHRYQPEGNSAAAAPRPVSPARYRPGAGRRCPAARPQQAEGQPGTPGTVPRPRASRSRVYRQRYPCRCPSGTSADVEGVPAPPSITAHKVAHGVRDPGYRAAAKSSSPSSSPTVSPAAAPGSQLVRHNHPAGWFRSTYSPFLPHGGVAAAVEPRSSTSGTDRPGADDVGHHQPTRSPKPTLRPGINDGRGPAPAHRGPVLRRP